MRALLILELLAVGFITLDLASVAESGKVEKYIEYLMKEQGDLAGNLGELDWCLKTEHKTINAILKAGLLPQLFKYLGHKSEKVKQAVVSILEYVCIYRKDTATEIYESGLASTLIDLLSSTMLYVPKNALNILGNIAQISAEVRENLIKMNVVEKMVEFTLHGPQDIDSGVAEASFIYDFLSHDEPVDLRTQLLICQAIKHLLENGPLPNALYCTRRLIKQADERTITKMFSQGTVEKLVSLINDDYAGLKDVMRALEGILERDPSHKSTIYSMGIVPRLANIVTYGRTDSKVYALCVMHKLTEDNSELAQSVLTKEFIESMLKPLIQVSRNRQDANLDNPAFMIRCPDSKKIVLTLSGIKPAEKQFPKITFNDKNIQMIATPVGDKLTVETADTNNRKLNINRSMINAFRDAFRGKGQTND